MSQQGFDPNAPHLPDRDLQVELGDQDDLAAVTRDLTRLRPARGRLHDWRLVMLVDPTDRVAATHVVGMHGQAGRWWITSRVLAIESERMLVQTTDGIYGLGPQAIGEAPPDLVDVIVATMRAHGLGTEQPLPVNWIAAPDDNHSASMSSSGLLGRSRDGSEEGGSS